MGPGRVGGRKFPRAKKQTERNEQPIGPIGTCDLFGGLFCGQRKQRFGKPIKDHSLGEMSGILLCVKPTWLGFKTMRHVRSSSIIPCVLLFSSLENLLKMKQRLHKLNQLSKPFAA